jgi:hypothetical protein
MLADNVFVEFLDGLAGYQCVVQKNLQRTAEVRSQESVARRIRGKSFASF